jgi:uncharacterized protein
LDTNPSSDHTQGKETKSPDKKEATSLMRYKLPTTEQIAKLPADGGSAYNRLIFESSPYLLQHARNPIDWRAWGDEALKLALSSDKPIFLSIGYTTCHWCHVMEKESFEDEEVARLLNENYICIKVDREERPDLDNVYMSVTQMMTGRGGWPMTVIMTPQKVPFFAGTYFPKSSMLDMLPHFSRIWKEEREKVDEVGRSIIENLAKAQSSQAGGDLNATHLDRCFDALSQAYDPEHGGFGQQPKFPTPHSLSFLVRYYQRTGKEEALNMVSHTLRQIRLSGTYDQIGWGIHRYSTDREWLVPHFEKMLYDQALFAVACLETYQLTKDPLMKEACKNTLDYVSRELSSPEGGFYSAEDADSEGEEGKFYLWTNDELISVLGDEDGKTFINIFGCESSGNYLDEATRQRTGKNIPHLKKSISEYSLSQDVSPKEFQNKLENIRKNLFNSREHRVHPQLDDKVLTDWNGLMISAFAKSGQAFGNKEYVIRAKKAADFCLSELRQPNGRLLKRWRLGKAGLPAHLEDYAFLAQGLIDLYEATCTPHYLDQAKQLIDLSRELFEDSNIGGFFLTAKDGEQLLTRPKEIYDGAIPSGNSVMAMNLCRIWKISGDEKYRECLNRSFSAFSGFLESNPSGAENFLHALAFVLHPPYEIVISGNLEDENTKKFFKQTSEHFLPFKTQIHLPKQFEKSKIVELAPYLRAFTSSQKPTFFLCRDYACEQPREDPKEVGNILNALMVKNQSSLD